MRILSVAKSNTMHNVKKISGSIHNKYILNLLVFLILIILPVADIYASGIDAKIREIDWFWFFYEHTEDLKGTTDVYRPFFMEAVKGDKLFQASLMPVLFWRYKDDRNDITKGFFGLYESVDYKHSGNKKDYDNGFFPLFLYGNGDKPEDKYFLLYPIGGNMHGKLGYERISPWVFPGVALFFLYPPSGLFTWRTLFYALAACIPVYTEFEFKDYSATAIFWPFITWGKGRIREDFRFLPFYAHNKKDGWYDNYQYLLLINYREMYLSDDERYTFFFFPFFGKKWSKNNRISSYTILWPFFSWGYDADTNDRSYNLPWPFIQIRDCDKPKVKSRIFFPIYGRHETSTYESMFVTPLYFRIKKEAEYFQSEYHITCIIAWYLKRDYSYNHEYYGRSWRYFKLWPLFQTEWNDSGMYSINILSLLPFRDTEGYEKLYQPFWTLFEYRVKPDGERHMGFLLRTYYQVWGDNFFKMKIPIIVSYERREESIREFTVLLGSFGYKKDNEGAYLKFLWLPIRIGEGDAKLSVNDETGFEDETVYKYMGKNSYNPWHGNLAWSCLDDKIYFQKEINF
jgi:hypothetical protein